MDWKRFVKSFGYAIQGIINLLRLEQTARIQFVAGLLVFFLAYLFSVSRIEDTILFFAVALVFVVEITNTAIEKMLDLLHPQSHYQVAFIKDAMAGASLIASIIALVVGLLIFYPYLNAIFKTGIF